MQLQCPVCMSLFHYSLDWSAFLNEFYANIAATAVVRKFARVSNFNQVDMRPAVKARTADQRLTGTATIAVIINSSNAASSTSLG